MVASHLYGLYVLTDFYIPKACHDYLQRVRLLCHFNYHEDFLNHKGFKYWEGKEFMKYLFIGFSIIIFLYIPKPKK